MASFTIANANGARGVLAAIGIGVGVTLVALVLGLASALLPWWFVLAVLILPLIFVAAIAAPEVGIVGMLLMVCGVVPERLAPTIGLGAGSIKAHELMIGLLFMLAVFRFSSLPPLGKYWRWLRPIFGIFALAVTGTLVAKLFFGTPLKDALGDARNHLAWLVVFPVICLIRTKDQVFRLQWGIVVVGAIVAIFALAQFVTGKALIQNARVEDLVTLNHAATDVTRSIVGAGMYFVIFSILFLLSRMMTRSISIFLSLPLLGMLIAGVVVTFGRGVWVATFLVIVLLAYWLMRWRGVISVLLIGFIGIAAALGGLALLKPNVIVAAYDRLISTGNETLSRNTTLGWRLDETNAALKQIKSSPIVGIGLGTPYKPVIRMNGVSITESDIVLTRYIHNGYIGLWLKFGFLGPVAVAFLVFGIVRRGILIARVTDDVCLRALTLTTVTAFLVPVITSVTQPEWLSQTGIAFFAVMFGLQIVTRRAIENDQSATRVHASTAALRQFR